MKNFRCQSVFHITFFFFEVYTHNVGRDRIIVDMDIAYAGDADFDVNVAGFAGGLNQLQVY